MVDHPESFNIRSKYPSWLLLSWALYNKASVRKIRHVDGSSIRWMMRLWDLEFVVVMGLLDRANDCMLAVMSGRVLTTLNCAISPSLLMDFPSMRVGRRTTLSAR